MVWYLSKFTLAAAAAERLGDCAVAEQDAGAASVLERAGQVRCNPQHCNTPANHPAEHAMLVPNLHGCSAWSSFSNKRIIAKHKHALHSAFAQLACTDKTLCVLCWCNCVGAIVLVQVLGAAQWQAAWLGTGPALPGTRRPLPRARGVRFVNPKPNGHM